MADVQIIITREQGSRVDVSGKIDDSEAIKLADKVLDLLVPSLTTPVSDAATHGEPAL